MTNYGIQKFCSHLRKTCGDNFRCHFYRVSPHWCEILIPVMKIILSVHPSITFRCSKKHKHIEKQTRAKRPQSGAKHPVSGRNVLVAKRPVKGRNVQGRNIKGAKHPVTVCIASFYFYMQGVIFCEYSRKEDEDFSLFFVKNFTETEESRFGYFFVKIHANQTRWFLCFSWKCTAAEIGLSYFQFCKFRVNSYSLIVAIYLERYTSFHI